MILGFVLAVFAAGFNAASNVIQRKANRDEAAELSMSLRLIGNLLRRPLWLASLGTIVVSFVLMVAALSLERLSAVQPIVVLELPLTLVGASWVLHARLTRREWTASVIMTVAVATLIVALDPSRGTNGHASGVEWALGSGVTAAVAVSALVFALRVRHGRRRAALLGLAAGLSFGLASAFTKGMTGVLAHSSFAGALTAWQTYAMVASGIVGMYLAQNALHAGELVVAQPGITLADPVVAVGWGTAVFHESIRTGAALVIAGVATVLIVGAVFALSHSMRLIEEAGS